MSFSNLSKCTSLKPNPDHKSHVKNGGSSKGSVLTEIIDAGLLSAGDPRPYVSINRVKMITTLKIIPSRIDLIGSNRQFVRLETPLY